MPQTSGHKIPQTIPIYTVNGGSEEKNFIWYINKEMKYKYSYQIVNNSPWPLTTSISLLPFIFSFIFLINHTNTYTFNILLLILSTFCFLYSLSKWLIEIIKESTYKGEHTNKVRLMIKNGLILFIVSEVIIFIVLFYTLFYIKNIPSIELNNKLIPSIGTTHSNIEISKEGPHGGWEVFVVNWKSIPLFNTSILFFGSILITAAQYYLINKNYEKTVKLYILTILLNLIFTLLQIFEYYYSFYTLTDSFYSNIFYFLTGWHAIHVILGNLFIFFSFIRLINQHYTNQCHLFSTFSSLYNHFIDIVWILLFLIVYIYL